MANSSSKSVESPGTLKEPSNIPVTELPMALENMLNPLLRINHITLQQIKSGMHSTQVILKFAMADGDIENVNAMIDC